MNILLYGTEPDRMAFENAIADLPELCYRSIRVSGFTDYNRFVAELGAGRPGLVVVAMDGAEGMEGVIAARTLGRDTPVLWFSDDRGFGVQSYRLGCAYFHEKPISAAVLCSYFRAHAASGEPRR